MGTAKNWWDVKVPMRDGVQLSADIYFPATGPDAGPYPVVLARSPYDNQHPVYVADARYLAEHGYAVVLQDVRGRYDSDGAWLPFRHEGPDGYDTVEWIADQPWCTGRVGTMGGSYAGWNQWALAREKPPHLSAMVSTAAAGAWMEELPWHNGVLMLVTLGWLNLVGGRAGQNPELVTNWSEVFRHLPVREMDEALGRRLDTWRQWVDHPTFDDYWAELRLDAAFSHLDVPALHITGWYDADQPGALFFHRGMVGGSSRAGDQSIVIGPWDHAGTRVPRQITGGIDFGRDAVMDVRREHLRWFDRWLKQDAASAAGPGARVFLTGENRWYAADTWPPPLTTPVAWYLRSGGAANTLAGDGRLEPDRPAVAEPDDTFTYDPADPVPAVIDENFYAADAAETPLDRRFQHRRDDVLVYTSAPADSEIVLTGIVEVHLFAATDGPDTDWFVALHDVAPSGASHRLVEGRLRGRFREGLGREVLLEAGQIYEFVVPTTAIGHVLRPAHRLRLTVTSSDFPTWDRNLNTGEPIGTGTTMRTARNRVSHRPDAASYVVLPVVPRSSIRRYEAS
jgi:putative CocE/NonD family hydrolase